MFVTPLNQQTRLGLKVREIMDKSENISPKNSPRESEIQLSAKPSDQSIDPELYDYFQRLIEGMEELTANISNLKKLMAPFKQRYLSLTVPPDH